MFTTKILTLVFCFSSIFTQPSTFGWEKTFLFYTFLEFSLCYVQSDLLFFWIFIKFWASTKLWTRRHNSKCVQSRKAKGSGAHFVYFNDIYPGIYSRKARIEKHDRFCTLNAIMFKSILFPSYVARTLYAIKCGTASILFLIWLHNCDNFIRHCRVQFETFGRNATRELRGVGKKCWKLCTRSTLWWDDLMNSGEGWKSGNKYFLHMSLFKVREKRNPNANSFFTDTASLESGARRSGQIQDRTRHKLLCR